MDCTPEQARFEPSVLQHVGKLVHDRQQPEQQVGAVGLIGLSPVPVHVGADYFSLAGNQ
jgi:hypothetical protein